MPSDTTNPTRRDFLKTMAAAAVSANIVGCTKTRRKPNLLFIWTDEQRADTMRIYGNAKIHAPNLNTLAAQSVVFRNATVSQPVCTPSRSTVMTGLMPHQNGCVENNIPLPENIPCLPELLDDPDYCTGYFGKWHLGDEIFPQHGFDEWESIEDMYRRHYRDHRDQSQKSSYWHFLDQLGYEPDTDKGDYSRGFAARLPIEHCKPKFLELKACDFLRRHSKQPFMLYINFLEPHMPFYGPLDNKHHPDEIDLPRNFTDILEENEPLRYRLIRERYRQRGFEGHDLQTESGWRRLIANYWGLVTQVDLSVGAILKTLAELGLDENTIVVYTSDHGDMMGAHSLLAKTVMYEEALKVPWLMRIPRLGKKQRIIENRVSQIDLVPTLLELMGKPGRKDLPGQSLLPLVNGDSVKEDHVFVEWNPPLVHGSPPQNIPAVPQEEVDRAFRANTRTVISPDGWKLCLSDGDKCQLFDLNHDPWETTNLFDSGRHKEVISRLTVKIHDWQQRVSDTVAI
ncbi:sulfatase-like hydrolase/transferase [candidate division KSB1 bacterium]|nr:sulfatase-like hydrolase/transferase [candidate division KSB1 bacterium]